MSAFNSSFTAAIPGSSLTHKLGSYPHEKPPKYTDPNQALEFIWTTLNRKDILKQVWSVLEAGGTVWALKRAILYKMCLEGLIQLSLALMIGPQVSQMIATLGAKKGIRIKMTPKFRDPTLDNIMTKHMNDKLGRKSPQPLPPSALKSTLMPKAADITKSFHQFTGSKPRPDGAVALGTTPKTPQAKGNGLLNTANSSPMMKVT